ncbi:MAG: DUF308 domain-containing protein [Lachnospiraceae bacterium]|nr:DUF308 domain-containing protein [Lachnospiraceae bacterium]
MAGKNEKSSRSNAGAVFLVAMISALLILFGAAMSFIPDMKAVYFVYVFGAVFIITGIIGIVKYFSKEEYRLVSNYDFSVGILFCILGVTGLIRAEEIAASFIVYIGLIMLGSAVVFLQYTLQLKILRSGIWGVTLAVTLLITGMALETLLEVFKLYKNYPDIFYYLIIGVGAIGLIWILVITYGTRRFLKTENEMSRRNLEEDITGEEDISASSDSADEADDYEDFDKLIDNEADV